MNEYIKKRVHDLYWNDDLNCAGTTLICLSEMFDMPLETQVLQAAAGMHGAGKYRAQCGLVEGALMFIGIYFHGSGKTEDEIVKLCYDYAGGFERSFGSLRCFDLRPGGFSDDDPPHLCEDLTCRAIEYAYVFISDEKAGLQGIQ